MGYYINPPSVSKETWLQDNGVGGVLSYPPPAYRDEDNVAVCWVHNGGFSAAGICYSQQEMDAFIEGRGGRHWHWFMVPIEKIYALHPFMKGIVV